jgi:hypothetical protein
VPLLHERQLDGELSPVWDPKFRVLAFGKSGRMVDRVMAMNKNGVWKKRRLSLPDTARQR